MMAVYQLPLVFTDRVIVLILYMQLPRAEISGSHSRTHNRVENPPVSERFVFEQSIFITAYPSGKAVF